MLKKLRLKSFKSFVDQSTEFSDLTLLVGANAAGKSNLIDAIRFLQGVALGMSFADVLRGRWDGGRLVWPGLRGGISDVFRLGFKELGIESEWGVLGETITHDIAVRAGAQPLLTHEGLRSSSVSKYLFDTSAPTLGEKGGLGEGGSVRVALKRTGKGDSPTQTHSGTQSLLHQINTSKPVAPEVARVRDALVAAMRGALFLDITPARMRDYSPKQVTQLGLEGENVSSVALSLCQDKDARASLVDWLSELCAPELDDIDFVETELGDVMLVFVERGGRRIPARSLSDGTLRFLGELLALRSAPEGSLLLIEEIENGLHPTRAHLLVEAMEAAAVERGIQVIATTHSPLVLNALSPEALRRAVLVARPPESEGSVLRKLGELPQFDEVAQRQGIDRMISSGWLERAV